jgi:hypothetical protein
MLCSDVHFCELGLSIKMSVHSSGVETVCISIFYWNDTYSYMYLVRVTIWIIKVVNMSIIICY